MADMGHCNYERLVSELQNCYDNNLGRADLGKSDHDARNRLLRLCERIVQDYVWDNGATSSNEINDAPEVG